MDGRLAAHDRLILQHILFGGTTADPGGKQLVGEFVAMAREDEAVAGICRRTGLDDSDLHLLFVTMVDSLHPNPCIDKGVPTLAASHLFMDPPQLESVLSTIQSELGPGMAADEREKVIVRHATAAARAIWNSYNVVAPARPAAVAVGRYDDAGFGTLTLLIAIGLMLIVLMIAMLLR